MTEHLAAAALAAFADAVASRDWNGLRTLLADDFTTTLLHTGEVLGADAYVDFNRSYPGDWVFAAAEIVDGGDRAVLRSSTTIDGQIWHAAAFGTSDSTGRITSMVEIWTDAVAPPRRE